MYLVGGNLIILTEHEYEPVTHAASFRVTPSRVDTTHTVSEPGPPIPFSVNKMTTCLVRTV